MSIGSNATGGELHQCKPACRRHSHKKQMQRGHCNWQQRAERKLLPLEEACHRPFKGLQVYTDRCFQEHASSAECKLQVMMEVSIRAKQYPIPFAIEEIVRKNLQQMLQKGIIEHYYFPYWSQVAVVKEKDSLCHTPLHWLSKVKLWASLPCIVLLRICVDNNNNIHWLQTTEPNINSW